jgi:hypothetical protein
MKWLCLSLIGLCLLGALTVARADSVKLRFGLFRHYGHILKVDNKTVTMQTRQGQLKTWPRSQVVSLVFDTPPAPGLPGKPVLPQNPLAATLSPPVKNPTDGPKADGLRPDALAEFRGQDTQTRYAGLYQLSNRPSCWLTLPAPARRLSFDVLPKWNPAQPKPGSFVLHARFLDETGRPVGQSPPVQVVSPGELLEWFTLLKDMSGVARPQNITWVLPPKTRQVEWIIPGEQRQLMGYMARVQLQP